MFIFRNKSGYLTQSQLFDRFCGAKWKGLLRKAKRLRRRLEERNELKVGEMTPLCPNCGQGLPIKWGRRKRKVQYFLGKNKTLSVQRYKCLSCYTTFGQLPNFIARFRRFAKKALRDMVDMKLWLSSSYRKTTKWIRIHRKQSNASLARDPEIRTAVQRVFCQSQLRIFRLCLY